MSLICVKYLEQDLAHRKCFLSVNYCNYVLVMLEDDLESLPHHKYRHYSPDCDYALKSYISSLCNLLEPSFFLIQRDNCVDSSNIVIKVRYTVGEHQILLWLGTPGFSYRISNQTASFRCHLPFLLIFLRFRCSSVTLNNLMYISSPVISQHMVNT